MKFWTSLHLRVFYRDEQDRHAGPIDRRQRVPTRHHRPDSTRLWREPHHDQRNDRHQMGG